MTFSVASLLFGNRPFLWLAKLLKRADLSQWAESLPKDPIDEACALIPKDKIGINQAMHSDNIQIKQQ